MGAGGTYVLFLRPEEPGAVEVGRLGRLELASGVYAYVGSGFGPGGVGARLRRHLRGGGATHWHVDYLRRRAQPAAAWLTRDPARREHEWAGLLSGLPGATSPLRGFGASDCGCETHLYHFRRPPALDEFRRRASAAADGELAAIHRLDPTARSAG